MKLWEEMTTLSGVQYFIQSVIEYRVRLNGSTHAEQEPQRNSHVVKTRNCLSNMLSINYRLQRSAA